MNRGERPPEPIRFAPVQNENNSTKESLKINSLKLKGRKKAPRNKSKRRLK